MKRLADQLERFKISGRLAPKDGAELISVAQQNAGDALKDIILESNPPKTGGRVISAKERLLDHNLHKQTFSLKFLSLAVLPTTFFFGVFIPDEKIKTSCFGIVSLIVGALIQESGNQKNLNIESDDKE